jgi:hypothetical protein
MHKVEIPAWAVERALARRGRLHPFDDELAVLTIGRDRDSLAAEIELEKAIAAAG